LTRREAEVLELIAQGLTNVEVARRLEVTIHAVKFHLASIYKKLGVANRTEAAGVFFQHLASLPDEAALTSFASAVPTADALDIGVHREATASQRSRGVVLNALEVARRWYAGNRSR
jgi:DNA-binding CsgD family transcriptional regulator